MQIFYIVILIVGICLLIYRKDIVNIMYLQYRRGSFARLFVVNLGDSFIKKYTNYIIIFNSLVCFIIFAWFSMDIYILPLLTMVFINSS